VGYPISGVSTFTPSKAFASSKPTERPSLRFQGNATIDDFKKMADLYVDYLSKNEEPSQRRVDELTAQQGAISNSFDQEDWDHYKSYLKAEIKAEEEKNVTKRTVWQQFKLQSYHFVDKATHLDPPPPEPYRPADYKDPSPADLLKQAVGNLFKATTELSPGKIFIRPRLQSKRELALRFELFKQDSNEDPFPARPSLLSTLKSRLKPQSEQRKQNSQPTDAPPTSKE
jgi:hypothetical protein